MIHPVWNQPIYFLSDPSHVVKKIVSSTSSCNRKKIELYHCQQCSSYGSPLMTIQD
jgi:hypothetical protein